MVGKRRLDAAGDARGDTEGVLLSGGVRVFGGVSCRGLYGDTTARRYRSLSALWICQVEIVQ